MVKMSQGDILNPENVQDKYQRILTTVYLISHLIKFLQIRKLKDLYESIFN